MAAHNRSRTFPCVIADGLIIVVLIMFFVIAKYINVIAYPCVVHMVINVYSTRTPITTVTRLRKFPPMLSICRNLRNLYFTLQIISFFYLCSVPHRKYFFKYRNHKSQCLSHALCSLKKWSPYREQGSLPAVVALPHSFT